MRLNGFGHTDPDVAVLLVGPDSQTAIVMSRVGEETAGNAAVTLRFDEAATVLPDEEVAGGTFRPTNHDGVAIAFNDPAPPLTSANADLSIGDGTDPNGEGRLFVQDAFPTPTLAASRGAGRWRSRRALRPRRSAGGRHVSASA